MIVKKAINMARVMNKPVLGVVENRSYLYVPEIDKKIEAFGESRGEKMARAAGASLIARIPIDPEMVKLYDTEEIERYNSELVAKPGESLARIVPVKVEQEVK